MMDALAFKRKIIEQQDFLEEAYKSVYLVYSKKKAESKNDY